jgi:hypothetical protein
LVDFHLQPAQSLSRTAEIPMQNRARRTDAPSSTDVDGVRVIETPWRSGAGLRVLLIGAPLLVGLGAVGLWLRTSTTSDSAAGEPRVVTGQRSVDTQSAETAAPATIVRPAAPTRRVRTATDQEPVQAPQDWPSADPNDLAAHFRPGDPVPTAGEVIQALQDAGDYTGLGAFNPPGTSPPLQGLAVPTDFVLPPGYVRHHQFTDEGEAIEPILMFAPDFVLRDARGQPLPMPENRVVPEALAPPGLPIRPAQVPPG